MKTPVAILVAVAASASLPPPASAQPGTRNAIVYGARAAGETDWHFGSLTLQSATTDPLTFEVGVFFFRAQGVGLATAAYKTYIDGVSAALGDSAVIVDDPGNGVSPSDGRHRYYNNGAQLQAVSSNRNAAIPGSGFRVSSSADAADAGAAGGVSAKQEGPLGNWSYFEYADGGLGYRFNVTIAYARGLREVLVHTPLSRINSYSTYNQEFSNTSSEHKATTVSDPITLQASWVPAPSTLTLLGMGWLIGARHRR